MKNYDKIKYFKEGVGYFPELSKYFRHGFSWSKPVKNYSYSYGSKIDVFQNNSEFHTKIGLSHPRRSILLVPEHKDKIVFLTREHLARKGHISGINIKCDAVFTKEKGVSMIVKVADCQTYYFYGIDVNDDEIFGLVHSGWRSTNMLFSDKVSKYAQEELKVLPHSIRIGLVPGIFQKDRTIQDFCSIDGDLDHWGKFVRYSEGNYYLDSRNFSFHQLLRTSILEENIFVYNVNTFDMAKKGFCFSQKLEYLVRSTGGTIKAGRFIVAMRT